MIGRSVRAGAVLCAAIMAAAPASAAPPPLALERTIPLPDVAGRIDHMALDPGRGHLFVAELGNNSVDMIDLASGQVHRRIGGLAEPQGIAYVAATDQVVVAGGGDGIVRFYGAGDLVPAGTLRLGEDADNLRIDPAHNCILVGYGSGALAAIDAVTHAKIAEAKLPGHPEAFELSADGTRAFVNVPEAGQIAVVDLRQWRQTTSWIVRRTGGNFPMALDPAGDVLASGFRDPPRLALIDAATGRLIVAPGICQDVDDVFFDDRRARLYLSCGEGVIEVFSTGAAGYVRIARIETASGARTAVFVPALDRLFIAAPAGLFGGSARILVYAPPP